ncbi:hypothetical protein BC834DRAFT_1035149 [Gloeopeniophorella convolvens]|nr:hypothetical protein BC834DRAFT_1035149 [Gloeopeniophorella convolvens]
MEYSQPSANLTFVFPPHNMDYLSPEFAPEYLEPGYMGPVEVGFGSNDTFPPPDGHPHPTSLLSELPEFAGLESANIRDSSSVPIPFNATSYNVATNNQPTTAFNAPGFCDAPTYKFGGDAAPPAATPVHDYRCESTPLSNYSSYGISAPEPAPLEFSGSSEPDQTTCIRPPWLSPDGNGDGWCTQEELDNMHSGYLPQCGSTHARSS